MISRRDATLILRSRFQDIPLRVLADEADVPYQALLKRRQRASGAMCREMSEAEARRSLPLVDTSAGVAPSAWRAAAAVPAIGRLALVSN